jgi:ppGpp synthetase/RelA/SpoT-type nucleotidyltranferase
MAWSARIFSKGRIDRAGEALVALTRLPEPSPLDFAEQINRINRRAEEVGVLDNWRACHAYPLQVIKMTLSNRAKKIDPDALVAQRLKRRPSIELKLRDNPNMKLSQMQDIGGCRAVLANVQAVKKLVEKYKEAHAKTPKNRSDWDGSDDFNYIEHPKPDGYRSVHLVFRFESSSPEHSIYNGQRIEIQIRSRLQHLWATAVETAQLFTGQALKSKVKNATEDWLRFFVLTSNAFALREKCQPVPNAPATRQELIAELRQIINRTDIMRNLSDWNEVVHMIEVPDEPDAFFYLLTLDVTKKTLNVNPFRKYQAAAAQEAYDAAEKATEKDENVQVVLVSVEDVAALRKAYPSYYVDTQDFISAVHRELNKRGGRRRARATGV